jgi:hypothetical protein
MVPAHIPMEAAKKKAGDLGGQSSRLCKGGSGRGEDDAVAASAA